jgi:hypothetical protein
MRLVVLTLVAGCDVVWGVPAQYQQDAPIDVPLIDAARDSETCVTFDGAIEADVILFVNTPTQGHPTEGVMNVGVAVQSQGLLRYLVPTLTARQHIAAVTLIAPYTPSSHTCGTAVTCGSCSTIAADGRIDVEYATSMWDEPVACYAKPTTLTSWQMTGALGAMDRSAPVGHAQYAKGTDLAIDLDPAALQPWIQNGKVSVILTPSLGAVALVPQKDFPTADQACNANQAPTRLLFKVCQ